MIFQKISEKIKTAIDRGNTIANTKIFTLEVKNEKIKKLLFLFFILLCIAFVFGLYKIETMSLAGFIITSIIFFSIYLYYFFQPVIPVIITKIIFYTSLLLVPASIYLRMQEINQIESEFAENILKEIAPQFIKYQFYVLFAASLVFEILLRLLSKYSQKLRMKIQKNPFAMRLYFFIVLVAASVLMEIFG